MEEKEINLKWLLFNIVMSWRKMVLMAVICAVLLTAAGYIYGRSKATENMQANIERQSNLKKYKNQLTEPQLVQTENAIKMYEAYQRRYVKMLNYMENSVWFNLDPSNVPTMTAEYFISAGKRSRAKDIAACYVSSIEQIKFPKELLPDIERAYLRELIKCDMITESDESAALDGEPSYVFSVKIVAESEEICRQLMELVHTHVSDMTEQIRKMYGTFELSLLSEKYYNGNDDEMKEQQDLFVTSCQDLTTSMKENSEGLNDDQLNYYREHMAGERIEEISRQDLDLFQWKYPLIGVLLGIFVLCMYEGIKYCMSSRIFFVDDFSSQIPVDVMGVIRKKQKYKGLDRWFYNGFTKNENKMPEEEALSLICFQIRLIMEKNGGRKVFLTGSADNERVRRICSRISEQVEGLEVTYGDCALYSVQSMKDMALSDGVVLVEQLGMVRYLDVQEEIELCNKYQVNIIGSVLVE